MVLKRRQVWDVLERVFRYRHTIVFGVEELLLFSLLVGFFLSSIPVM
jgi:hypothetical protein